MPIIETFLPRLLHALSQDINAYRDQPPELADTCVTVFFCYRDNDPVYTAEAVRGMVLYDALVLLGGAVRVIVTSTDPPFCRVMQAVGLRPKTFRGPHGTPVELLVGDKRGKGFLSFLVYIERLISSVSSHKMTREDMERLLCALANPRQLLVEIRSLGLKDNLDTTKMHLMQLLTSSPPIPPLRKQSQDLLKAAYLHREWSVAQIATHFHVSRSSFYRHKRKALEELAEAWNARHQ